MKTIIKIITSLALLLPLLTVAQSSKYQINGVKVIQHGDTLRNAWAGGLNNPVISPIDLNQDGLMDLFIYDKAGWKALSFLNTGSVGHPSFTYAPQYDRIYPTTLRNWAVIRDYNRDGISDILALNVNSGITAFRGVRSGTNMSFETAYNQLLYPWAGINPRIWTFADNMPVLMDVDGDGDLDIISPDNLPSLLDYYQNTAVENGYSPDSMTFTLTTGCWGNFYEDGNDCNVTLNQGCAHKTNYDPQETDPSRDLRHQGGSIYGTHHRRNSHLTDIFLGDILCDNMKLLINGGDTSVANITSVDTTFPHYDVPVSMPLFPAVYELDADNDGFADLMVAPFASNGDVESQSIDINVIKYYHNNGGTDSINTYHYEGDTLINNSIVDVGTESHPVFYDYNHDGLMDIVIGRYGQFLTPSNAALGTPGGAISSLYLYKNIGSDTLPVFLLVDTDWNHLSVFDAHDAFDNMYPAFGDLDGDGHPDMVVGNFAGNIAFFHNAGTTVDSFPSMTASNWFGIDVGFDAAPFIYDVNGDGLMDLVIGSSGRTPDAQIGSHIFYYWNFGTPTHPMFSPDSVNNFFGNVQVWDYHIGTVQGFATPVLRQENGSTVLYSGSQRGFTLKFAVDPDSLRSGTFALIDSDLLGVKPGIRSNVSIADINHDGHNDYLTGNIRGGIMLFSDTAWTTYYSTTGIAAITPNEDLLKVYPNPAKDMIICHLTQGNSQLVSAQLYDILGASVSTTITRSDESGIVLSVAGLSPGIYVIQASDRSGKSYQHKIAIMK